MPRRIRSRQRTLAITLTLLIILPVLIFSVFELASLNSTERLLTGTYNQQLDGVLTSVNQYAWDLLSIWAAGMNRMIVDGVSLDSVLTFQVDRHQSVEGAFIADSLGHVARLKVRNGSVIDRRLLDRPVEEATSGLWRMIQLRQTGYTRLQPHLLDSTAGDMRVILLFPIQLVNGTHRLAGIVIEPERFSRDVLGPRLLETAGSQFIAAVFRSGTDDAVYVTDDTSTEQILHRRTLWIFPQLEVGLRFRGESPEDIAASRSRQLLYSIIAVDLLLITGAFLTYRNAKRESELAKLKSDFVSNVSHELRTPLALIRMYAETLDMDRIKDERKKKEYYATIVSETGRLSRLVNNILNFSRMEAGRMPFALRSGNLNSVVTSSVEIWKEHLRTENVELVMDLAEGLPSVRIDEEAIGEALMNLIDNAVKYGGEKKFLGLATGTTNGRAFVRIEDHGIGIARKDSQKIFEMFYRSTERPKEGAHGSGVGLAIVRTIMQAHGGEAAVDSTPGKGSVFTLWFPLQ